MATRFGQTDAVALCHVAAPGDGRTPEVGGIRTGCGGARPRLLNKETRNAGEKPVPGFMGSLLNPKAAGSDVISRRPFSCLLLLLKFSEAQRQHRQHAQIK
jgi:hypothetical protein